MFWVMCVWQRASVCVALWNAIFELFELGTSFSVSQYPVAAMLRSYQGETSRTSDISYDFLTIILQFLGGFEIGY